MTLLPVYKTSVYNFNKVFNYLYDGYCYRTHSNRLVRCGHKWPYNLKERVRCSRENQ